MIWYIKSIHTSKGPVQFYHLLCWLSQSTNIRGVWTKANALYLILLSVVRLTEGDYCEPNYKSAGIFVPCYSFIVCFYVTSCYLQTTKQCPKIVGTSHFCSILYRVYKAGINTKSYCPRFPVNGCSLVQCYSDVPLPSTSKT